MATIRHFHKSRRSFFANDIHRFDKDLHICFTCSTPEWSKLPGERKSAVMNGLANTVERHKKHLATNGSCEVFLLDVRSDFGDAQSGESGFGNARNGFRCSGGFGDARAAGLSTQHGCVKRFRASGRSRQREKSHTSRTSTAPASVREQRT